MKNYLELLERVLTTGTEHQDRTGVGIISTFGECLKFDLRNGFPIVTTKNVYFHACKYELKWFLNGDTNIKYLQDNKVRIWNEWADKDGNLGPVYGSQWRNWNGHVDQLQNVIDLIKFDPYSRRMVVSAWNADKIQDMALPPCHMFYQFNVDNEYLDVLVYQRSADLFLGVPFNIVEYAMLLEIVSKVTNKIPRNLIYSFGNTHIYKNHIDQVKLQLTREPFILPKLVINQEINNINEWDPDKTFLKNYLHHETIKASVAV
jgi:thymidylate synthase